MAEGDSELQDLYREVLLDYFRDAAHKVWISSVRDGPDYRVPVETMLSLARSIGEPL